MELHGFTLDSGCVSINTAVALHSFSHSGLNGQFTSYMFNISHQGMKGEKGDSGRPGERVSLLFCSYHCSSAKVKLKSDNLT